MGGIIIMKTELGSLMSMPVLKAVPILLFASLKGLSWSPVMITGLSARTELMMSEP